MQGQLRLRINQLLEQGVQDHIGYETLARLLLPGPDYYEHLGYLHKALVPKLYVEIGVRDGRSLALAAPATRCIAIDPQPRVNIPEWPNRKTTTWAITHSDRYFEREDAPKKVKGFDLALIDGDHSFAQALRDFENLEKLAGPASIITLHDVIPMDERTATPTCGTSFWTGDVWRLMASLVARPDLVAFTVATPPTGLGIIGRFGSIVGSTPQGVIDAVMQLPFPSTWEDAVHMLNIVPNEPGAIMQALQGKAAA